ncbi:MAG: RNA polymerase sporulation sigma factor SigK [Lachnospiraceae bacterium]|nr:RNA polymerase sporulation sigma factor SigK [Lachnospiraceae bacterium]
MKTFQQPLSKGEEERYLYLLKHGNPQESQEAKEVLIERNLRLVAHIAKKYQDTDVETQDLISIGTIGLIKAIISFDTDKNSKLATYAAKCIDNELLMMLRTKKKLSREVSIYEPIGTDKEGNEISLLDILKQEQQDIIEEMNTRENISQLQEIIEKCLNKREKEIILLRYGLITGREITQREIGEYFGISRSYISRIEKKALLKLRTEYERRRKESF